MVALTVFNLRGF